MIAVYFFGTGVCCALVAASESFETLAIALFGVGLFAAIYHPVGTPMVVDAAVTRGRTMAFNGICGNIGVSIASGCTAVIASGLGWRFTFLIPAAVFILSGLAYLRFIPNDGGRRVVQAPDQDHTDMVYAGPAASPLFLNDFKLDAELLASSLAEAAKLRAEAGLMTMAVGLIVHADQAETILQRGQADLIAIAREVLYNPNWPMDAAQKLGVDKQFASVPPPQAYWLSKRASSVKGVVPSTFQRGISETR